MVSSNSALTSTWEIRDESHIHYRSSTAQKRPNHHSPSCARGLPHRHDRPRRRRTARTARAGSGLATPACPPRLGGPPGLDRRRRGLGLAGLPGRLFGRFLGRFLGWGRGWLDDRLCRPRPGLGDGPGRLLPGLRDCCRLGALRDCRGLRLWWRWLWRGLGRFRWFLLGVGDRNCLAHGHGPGLPPACLDRDDRLCCYGRLLIWRLGLA